ncbi:MAG TPA: PAS domain-containing protein [Alphaproteobacteria bacterium]|nr:PAS domain-containing protein [Alphaproteobacteria bacterium]
MTTEETDVQFPRLAAVLRYWNRKRGTRQMPARRDIDPVEIPSLLPVVLLAEIDGAEARMRLMGEEAAHAFRRDVRGCSVRDFEFGAFTASWIEAFELVIASSAPAVAAGTCALDAHPCRVETVLAPLADDAGALSHVFGGLVVRPVARDEPAPVKTLETYVLPLVRRGAEAAEERHARVFRTRGRKG